jgi:hypothetical protein
VTRDVGDLIGIRYEARDSDGDLVAATVAVTVTAPDDTTDTPAVSPASTGLYDSEFTADAVGTWRWKWSVSGAITDVQYGSVDVGDPGPDTYVSLVALRESVNIPYGDRDGRLGIALSAAARAVDSFTGRRPGGFYLSPTATSRTYETCATLYANGRYQLLVDEIGSLTGLIVEIGAGTTWSAVTDYRVSPPNALADGQPITSITSPTWWGDELVRVTARHGWPVTPPQVASATLIQATRLYKRKESPDGVAGDGSLGVVRLARVDPDVQALLSPFVLPGIA